MLSLAETVALRAPTDVGTKQSKDVDAPLSEIIDVLNERFGTEFTRADQLLFDQFIEERSRVFAADRSRSARSQLERTRPKSRVV
jgi:type I restriction enzyme R subunit